MDRWGLSLAVAKAACVNSQGMGGSRRGKKIEGGIWMNELQAGGICSRRGCNELDSDYKEQGSVNIFRDQGKRGLDHDLDIEP